jgi:hypothetical protein
METGDADAADSTQGAGAGEGASTSAHYAHLAAWVLAPPAGVPSRVVLLVVVSRIRPGNPERTQCDS